MGFLGSLLPEERLGLFRHGRFAGINRDFLDGHLISLLYFLSHILKNNTKRNWQTVGVYGFAVNINYLEPQIVEFAF